VGKVNAHVRCKRKALMSNHTPILQEQNVPTLAPTSESWTMGLQRVKKQQFEEVEICTWLLICS
jgi:hypothetical protein